MLHLIIVLFSGLILYHKLVFIIRLYAGFYDWSSDVLRCYWVFAVCHSHILLCYVFHVTFIMYFFFVFLHVCPGVALRSSQYKWATYTHPKQQSFSRYVYAALPKLIQMVVFNALWTYILQPHTGVIVWAHMSLCAVCKVYHFHKYN